MTGFEGLLSGSVATLVIARLARALIRLPRSLPVDIHPFLQHIDLEEARAAFDGQGLDRKFDDWGLRMRRRLHLQLRRDLHTRMAESRAHLERMAANVRAIRRHADNDPQRGKVMQGVQAEESRRRVSEAEGMLAGAALFERDAGLPEHSAEAEEFRRRAASLRLEAQRTLEEDAERKREILEDTRRLHEVRRAAHRFQFAAGAQFFKINLLTLVFRLDKLGLVSAGRAAGWWVSGIDHVFDLYECVQREATVYWGDCQQATANQAGL